MVDIHTHILPGIDDGATDKDISLTLLKILEDDGVNDVVLTPHFYSDSENIEQFIQRRNQAYSELKSVYKGNINLHLGAEVYLSKYIANYDDLTELCIDKTKYILVECPFSMEFSSDVYEIIENFIYNHRLTPIIAHIERYHFTSLNKDLSLIESLRSIGCLIQINADSLLLKKTKKLVLKLIENNLVDCIGTDTHNLTHRPPNYIKAIDVITKNLGAEYAQNISTFAEITKVL